MFNSVVDAPPVWKVGNLKSGTGLSLLAHAAVLLVALVFQNRVTHTEAPASPEVVFKRPPKGNPTPAPAAAAARTPPPKPKKRTIAPPTVVKPLPVDPLPAVATLEPAPLDPSLPFIEGSDPTGVETNGTPHTTGANGDGLGNGIDVVSFGEGMTKPVLLSGQGIEYTREAREAHVAGMFIARCTITREGDVRDCRTVKSVPLMSEAVIAALLTRKYSPVRFQGEAVSVTYVFNVRLQMP